MRIPFRFLSGSSPKAIQSAAARNRIQTRRKGACGPHHRHDDRHSRPTRKSRPASTEQFPRWRHKPNAGPGRRPESHQGGAQRRAARAGAEAGGPAQRVQHAQPGPSQPHNLWSDPQHGPVLHPAAPPRRTPHSPTRPPTTRLPGLTTRRRPAPDGGPGQPTPGGRQRPAATTRTSPAAPPRHPVAPTCHAPTTHTG